MAEHARVEDPFADFDQGPGPPGDWTRLAGDALGGNFEALRTHLEEGETGCVGWCPICRLADLSAPTRTPEMREQWSAIQREALLAVRTLDQTTTSSGASAGTAGTAPRVEDIPID